MKTGSGVGMGKRSIAWEAKGRLQGEAELFKPLGTLGAHVLRYGTATSMEA